MSRAPIRDAEDESRGGPGGDGRRLDRHYQALLRAEARRLATQLGGVGEGVREGTTRKRPFGFLDAERPNQRPTGPHADREWPEHR